MRNVPIRVLLAVAFLLGGTAGCRPLAGRAATLPPATQPVPTGPTPEQLIEEAEWALRDGDPGSAVFLLEETLGRGDLEAERRRELLLRVAMLHADSASAVHDPVRVRALLERVLQESPGSPEARQAAVIRSLLDDLDAQQTRRFEAEERMQRLSTRMLEVERALGACQDEVERIKQIILAGEQPPPR